VERLNRAKLSDKAEATGCVVRFEVRRTAHGKATTDFPPTAIRRSSSWCCLAGLPPGIGVAYLMHSAPAGVLFSALQAHRAHPASGRAS